MNMIMKNQPFKKDSAEIDFDVTCIVGQVIFQDGFMLYCILYCLVTELKEKVLLLDKTDSENFAFLKSTAEWILMELAL